MSRRKVVISKEELYDLYWKQKLSMQKIADKYNCSYFAIYYYMNKYNIERRTHSELNGELSSMFGKKIPKDVLEKRQRNRVYRPRTEEEKRKISKASRGRRHTEESKHKMSKIKMGHPVSEETRKKMSKAKTGGSMSEEVKKKLSALNSGENHPQWKGGISFEPYCNKFNGKLKEEIREKYNRNCILCNKCECENGQRLSIHHVDYNKSCGCDGLKCVLVPLCQSCHAKTNHNREYWENLIIDKVFKKSANPRMSPNDEQLHPLHLGL